MEAAGNESNRVIVRFWVTEALRERDVAHAAAILDDDERARASRLRLESGRRDYIAAHALLRRELSRVCGHAPASWRFTVDDRGRPSIAAPDLAAPVTFTLSHTDGLVACAVAGGLPVGVDVERIDGAVHDGDIARRFFTEAEVAHIAEAGVAGVTRFFELWTLKEAYSKALGLGLAHPMRNSSFRIGPDGTVEFTFAIGEPTSGWSFVVMEPMPGARLAAAVGPPAGSVAGRVGIEVMGVS